MLGQPLSMLLPRVVGIELAGALPPGSTATDLVLTVAELLRKHGVVGQVRRVLRRGRGARAAREPGDDREHVARVRLDVHDLSDRRRDAALPACDWPARRSGRARRGVRQGTRTVARPRGASRVRRNDLARPLDGRAVARRPRPAAGSGAAVASEARVRAGVARGPAGRRERCTRCRARQQADESVARIVPGERSARAGGRCRRERIAAVRATAIRAVHVDRKSCPVTLADGRAFDLRRRSRGDRRHHVVHEHVEPVGDDRGRTARPQRSGAWAARCRRGSRRRSRPVRSSLPSTTNAPI